MLLLSKMCIFDCLPFLFLFIVGGTGSVSFIMMAIL